MTTPNPACTVNGSSTVNGVDVTAGSVPAIALASIAGADFWSLTCVETDDSTTPAAINATLILNAGAKTATYTHPSGASAVLFESKVGTKGPGLDANGRIDQTYTTTFGVYAKTVDGNRTFATNETTEGSAASGWVTKLNALTRAVETLAKGLGGGGALLAAQTPGRAEFDSTSLISSNPAGRQWQPWAPLGNTPCTIHPHYDYDRTGTYRDAVALNLDLSAAGGGQYMCTWFTATETRPTFDFWAKNLAGGTRLDAYIWDPAVTVKATSQFTTSGSWQNFTLQVAGGTPLTVGNNYFCVFDLRPGGTQTSVLLDPTIKLRPGTSGSSGGAGIFAAGQNWVRLAMRGELLSGNLDLGDIYKGNPWWWELNSPFSEMHIDTNTPTLASEWFAASAGLKGGYLLGNRRYAFDTATIPTNGSLIDQQTIAPATALAGMQRVIVKNGAGQYTGAFNYTTYLRALYLPAGYAARVIRPGC